MSKANISGEKNPNWKGGKTLAHCVDCGKRISKYHKRCKSCARKGERGPNWKGGVSKPNCIDCGKPILLGNERCFDCWHKFNQGENHVGWTGGKPKCADCGKELSNYTGTRCSECYLKYATKENHSHWKGGWPKCIDCGKELGRRDATRCADCSQKYAVGENHPNWQGGIGKLPYPYEFNKKLKELIRERDNYTCQICDIKEKVFYRKLDVHHIDYDKDNLDPRNLISLCQNCHSRTNFKREYWQKYFAELKGT